MHATRLSTQARPPAIPRVPPQLKSLMPAMPYQLSKTLAYTPVRSRGLPQHGFPAEHCPPACPEATPVPARLPGCLPSPPARAPSLPQTQVMSKAMVLAGGQKCADRVNLAYKTLQASGGGGTREGRGMQQRRQRGRQSGAACLGRRSAQITPRCFRPSRLQGELSRTPEGRLQLANALV